MGKIHREKRKTIKRTLRQYGYNPQGETVMLEASASYSKEFRRRLFVKNMLTSETNNSYEDASLRVTGRQS